MTPTNTPLPAEAVGLIEDAQLFIEGLAPETCSNGLTANAAYLKLAEALAALASAPVVGGGGDREAVQDDHIELAFDSVGIKCGTFYGRNRLLAAGRLILALSVPIPVDGWRPTHRHVKRGTEYEWMGYAHVQAARPVTEETLCVVYRDKLGALWVRPNTEFFDGRFELFSPPPTAPEGGGV